MSSSLISKIILTGIATCALTVLTAACTKNADPLRAHEGAKTQTTNQDLAEKDNSQLSQDQAEVFFQSLQLKQNLDLLNSKPDQALRIATAISEKLLTEATLQQPYIARSTQLGEAFRLLNLSILGAPEGEEKNKLLALYEKFAFFGCSAKSDLRGCQFTTMFAKDAYTGKVLTLIAQKKTNLADYYSALNLALDLTKIESRETVYAAYVEKSKDYRQELSSASADADANARLQRLDKLLQFINNSKTSQAPSNINQTEIDSAKEISNIEDKLIKDNPKSWSLLKMEKMTVADKAQLPHLIFEGRVTIGDSITYFEKNRIDVEQFSMAVRQYLKLRFYQNLVETNEIYIKAIDGQFDGDRFLDRIQGNVSVIERQWKLFISNADRLGKFVQSMDIEIGQKDSLLVEFNRLKYNIRISSLYPHMIALVYYIVKYRLELNFKIWWFIIKIEANDFITQLMFGQMAPQFDYGILAEGQNSPPMNQIEMKQAFSIGLQSGLFDKMNVNVGDFLNVIFQKTTDLYNFGFRPKSDFSIWSLGFSQLNEKLVQNLKKSEFARRFKASCDVFSKQNSEQNSDQNIPLNIEDVATSPAVGNLMQNLMSLSADEYAGGLFPFGNASATWIQMLKNSFYPMLFLANEIYADYETSLAFDIKDPALRAEMVRKSRDPIEKTKKTIQELVELLKTEYLNYHDCAFPVFEKDRSLKFELMGKFLNMSDFVFQSMKNKEFAKLQQFIDTEFSSDSYKSMAKVTEGKIVFRRFDILNWIAKIVHQQNPQIVLEVPARWKDKETLEDNTINFEVTTLVDVANQEQFKYRWMDIFKSEKQILSWFGNDYNFSYKTREQIRVLGIIFKLMPTQALLRKIMDIEARLLNFNRLGEKDFSILKYLGRDFFGENKYLSDDIKELYVSRKSNEPFGLFDRIAYVLTSQTTIELQIDDLASCQAGDIYCEGDQKVFQQGVMPTMVEAEKFYYYRVNSPTLILGNLNATLEKYQKFYRELVRQTFSFRRMLTEESNKMDIDLSLRMQGREQFSLYKLSPQAEFRINSYYDKFNRATGNYWANQLQNNQSIAAGTAASTTGAGIIDLVETAASLLRDKGNPPASSNVQH